MDSSVIFYHPTNSTEFVGCFFVIKELRPHLSQQDFLNIIQMASQNDGYTLVALKEKKEDENGPVIAVMGYRILYDFVHGKHVYIDDLCVTETKRSLGLGKMLLSYAEKIAKENNCKGLRLCTGVENERGKKFYTDNGLSARAIAYKKKLAMSDKLV